MFASQVEGFVSPCSCLAVSMRYLPVETVEGNHQVVTTWVCNTTVRRVSRTHRLCFHPAVFYSPGRLIRRKKSAYYTPQSQDFPQIRIIKTMGPHKRTCNKQISNFGGFGAFWNLLITPPAGVVEAVPPRIQLQCFKYSAVSRVFKVWNKSFSSFFQNWRQTCFQKKIVSSYPQLNRTSFFWKIAAKGFPLNLDISRIGRRPPGTYIRKIFKLS